MFRSATLRLTLWYLAILMTVSLFFTAVLYITTSRVVDHGLQRTQLMPNSAQLNFFLPQTFGQYRLDRIDSIKASVAFDLIWFNLVVLIAGGGASFLLARRTLRPIEESLTSQKRFTSDASHELRTPLAVMRTQLEVSLLEQKLSPTEVKELLGSNLEEVKKLEALSGGLLRLAQYTDGRAVPEWETVELDKVVAQAIDRLKSAAQAHHIKIHNEIAKLTLEADQQSLVELFVILIDNALKYSGTGKTIEITGTSQGGQALIEIVDHGIGIKPSDLPHIFDRFYRADSSHASQVTEGYGLGLAIVKQIVDLHHGHITVVSTLGSGSGFTVKLPLKQPKSPVRKPF